MADIRGLCSLALFLANITSLGASRCGCHRPEKSDQTRWGGNEVIVQVAEGRYSEMTGVVNSSIPEAGVLVEVFDNPGYLLDESRRGSHPEQKRLRACVTGDDGSFCFRNLPSGKYELRASVSPGWDVTHVYIVIDRKSGSKESIDVRLHIGT